MQPMQVSGLTSTMPSEARLYDAPVGQTVTQAGVSQCRQERGKCTVRLCRAVAHLIGMHAVEPGAVRIAAVGVLVGQRRRIAAGVPFLAARRAGLTADAGVEIDHQAELLVGVRPAALVMAPARRGERRRMQRLELRQGFAGLVRRGLLDADAQVVPRRLAGDRIAVGEAVAAFALGQQFSDQMVEQEAARRFRRVGVERGGAGAPADRVPGPHRVGIDALHQPDAALDAADARS